MISGIKIPDIILDSRLTSPADTINIQTFAENLTLNLF